MVLKDNLRIVAIFTGLAITASGCSGDQAPADAYGQFEVDEVQVSAQAQGELVDLDVSEGRRISKGDLVGRVESDQLLLQRDEVIARQQQVRARMDELQAEKAVLREELEVARVDLKRIKSLRQKGAATQKQLDDIEGRIRVLKKQISSTESRRGSIQAELKSLEAREAQLTDQINKADIINPINGRVLNKLVESNEVVRWGEPVYTIANLDTMILRAYVSGAQLAGVKLGDKVKVRYDRSASSMKTLDGRVRWVAEEAEFTPQMIQTRDERVTQVYAFEVSVPNPEGEIKIGMPGEVDLPE